MIQRKDALLVCACLVALICAGIDVHGSILENHYHTVDLLEREQAVTSLLEQTLSHLKEQREQVGMTYNFVVVIALPILGS